MEIVLGILLLIAAVFLVAAVLLQDSKDHRLSGSIAGGADTFYGKNQGATKDKILSKATSVVAIVFCLIVVAMYIFQPTTDYSGIISSGSSSSDTTVADSVDTADTAAGEDDASSDTEANADTVEE